MNNLVQRIGPVVPGGALPRGLRQQRWSPVNVPLMWAAASDREFDPVLQWLGDRASRIQQPVSFHGGECSASEGVRLGFSSLRDVMRVGASRVLRVCHNGCDNTDSLRPDRGTTSQQGVKSTSSLWDAQLTPESHFSKLST